MIESPEGPMLVYAWADGELLRQGYDRFKTLSPSLICGVLDQIYELHQALAAAGWIAVDFYDGCLIFDYVRHHLSVVDLDMYHRGPFHNEMGRMWLEGAVQCYSQGIQACRS